MSSPCPVKAILAKHALSIIALSVQCLLDKGISVNARNYRGAILIENVNPENVNQCYKSVKLKFAPIWMKGTAKEEKQANGLNLKFEAAPWVTTDKPRSNVESAKAMDNFTTIVFIEHQSDVFDDIRIY